MDGVRVQTHMVRRREVLDEAPGGTNRSGSVPGVKAGFVNSDNECPRSICGPIEQAEASANAWELFPDPMVNEVRRDDSAIGPIDPDAKICRVQPVNRITTAVYDLNVHQDVFSGRAINGPLLCPQSCGQRDDCRRKNSHSSWCQPPLPPGPRGWFQADLSGSNPGREVDTDTLRRRPSMSHRLAVPRRRRLRRHSSPSDHPIRRHSRCSPHSTGNACKRAQATRSPSVG